MTPYHKTEYKERRNHYAFYSVNVPVQGFDTDRETFIGLYNGFDEPDAVLEGRFQPVLFAFYHCIIHAMAALVRIKRSLGWLPTGIPDRALVVDIEITASGIHGHPVVAVAGEPPEFGVFIETVASGRIADKREASAAMA